MSLIDKVSTAGNEAIDDAGHFAAVFGKSAWRAGAIEPWNGVAQLVDEGTNLVGLGKPLPQVQIDNSGAAAKESASDWTARTLGSGVGMLLPFLITDAAVGKALDGKTGAIAFLSDRGGLAAEIAPFVRPIASGAAYGLIFTPSDPKGNFLAERGISAVTGGVTFGAQRAATLGLLKGLSATGLPIAETALAGGLQSGVGALAVRIGANVVGGTLAGAASAESNSLLHGKGLATTQELEQAAATFAVTGGALEMAHMGGEYISSRRAPAAVQPPTALASTEKTMEVQSRIADGVEGPVANSQLVLQEKAKLDNTLQEKINAFYGKKSGADATRHDFANLLDQVSQREYDGVGMNGAHLAQTFSSVDRLLNAKDLTVKLSAAERLGLAHQLLSEAANPYNVPFGSHPSPEATGVQSLLNDRVPGKISQAVISLLTEGKYTSSKDPLTSVDFSKETLSRLPVQYRNTLAPDLEARQSLSTSLAGQENSPGTRTYSSQLKQLLINNLGLGAPADGHLYVYGPSDPALANDSGERLFVKQDDGSYQMYKQNGSAQVSSRLKTPDLQPIFDHVSGVNNDSAVLKNGNYFLITNTDGLIGDGKNASRFGLYGHDTRFLSQWDIKLNGQTPSILDGSVKKGYAGQFIYTNKAAASLAADTVSLHRDVVINKDTVSERLRLHNNTDAPQTVHLTVGSGSDFADMFEVRGWQRNERGQINEPIVSPDSGRIILSYKGLDGATVSTDISANGNGAETAVTADGVHFTVTLPAKAEHSVELAIKPGLNADHGAEVKPSTYEKQLADADDAYGKWRNSGATIETDNADFNKVVERAYRDLYMLRISSEHGDAIAAGIPWYVARFGRDQEITSMQTLLMQPDLAKGVLLDMAAHQGTKVDAETAEKPGKMMHELRVGEMARNKEIPFTPYFGTVDATPLWLSLLGKYVQQTGDVELAKQLQPNVDAALNYLDDEVKANGYIRYGGTAKEALSNQGWKDSGDSIMHADGTLLQGPITLAEPQGYLFDAWRQAARLSDLSGDNDRAALLHGKADDLKARFNQDFWMPEKNYAALALDGAGRQAQVISSNPGHLLSTGILSPENAQSVVQRLMQPDMFSGFGIRTLSDNEVRFNPGSYHNGTVWPHDVSMIAAGIHDLTPESGMSDRVLTGMFDAAKKYPNYRLPELFGGFRRGNYPEPIPYPETSSPQAWAAGSMFQLLGSTLGLHANGIDNSLLVFKPTIPDDLGSVKVRGLRVGQNRVDLQFDKVNGQTTTKVLSNDGNVQVNVQKS